MPCEILDFRCFFVSEIAGDPILATFLGVILYFVAAARLNWGFNTTVGFLFPAIFIITLGIAGFSAVMAFSTMIIAIMIATIFNRFIGNR